MDADEFWLEEKQKHEYCWGTIRIRNPKTLQRWISSGRFQKQLKEGWIFNPGCGRFRKEKCTCSKCRKRSATQLKEVLIKNGFEI